MEFIRKSLKAYFFAFVIFVLFTFFLASIIYFTSFKESWSFAGLIFGLSVAVFMLGIIEGGIAGRRGLIVGIVSAAVFLLLTVLTAAGIFADSFSVKNVSVFYIIPLAAGTIGGIIGTNANK